MIEKAMDEPKSPYFKFLVVVDIEATCEESVETYPHEIIQLPAVLIDTEKVEVIDKVSFYVRPVINPTLSKFCSQLTGISQRQVDEAQPFPIVLKEFEKWLESHGLGVKTSFSIVTDGSYDLGKFFLEQCKRANISFPRYAERWINIRRAFNARFKTKLPQTNLKKMLSLIGDKFEGKPHNGLDDSINISKIVLHLLKLGVDLYQNERIVLGAEEQQENILRQRLSKGPRWMYLPLVAPISFKEFLKIMQEGQNRPSLNFYSRKVKVDEKENCPPASLQFESTCDCKIFCASKQAALVKLILKKNPKDLSTNQFFEGEFVQTVSGMTVIRGPYSPQISSYPQGLHQIHQIGVNQPGIGHQGMFPHQLGPQPGPCSIMPIQLGANSGAQQGVMSSQTLIPPFLPTPMPGFYQCVNIENVFPN